MAIGKLGGVANQAKYLQATQREQIARRTREGAYKESASGADRNNAGARRATERVVCVL